MQLALPKESPKDRSMLCSSLKISIAAPNSTEASVMLARPWGRVKGGSDR